MNKLDWFCLGIIVAICLLEIAYTIGRNLWNHTCPGLSIRELKQLRIRTDGWLVIAVMSSNLQLSGQNTLITSVTGGWMKPRTTKKCVICKTVFTKHRTTDKYCSPACAKQAQILQKKRQGKKETAARRSADKTQLDTWSLKVKELAGFKCEYCGKPTGLNSHHIFSRSNKSTRYDLDNGVCLCVGHHTFSSSFSAHKTPAEFIEWIKEKKGDGWYEKLRRKAKSIRA